MRKTVAMWCLVFLPCLAAAAEPLPDRLIGYGIVNHWQAIDAGALADHLARRKLNFTSIEYVPGEWYKEHVRDPDPRKAVDRAKTLAFVQAMRKKGVWTHINMVNWNGHQQQAMPTSWFRGEFEWIKANIGTERVILQAVSEWDDKDTKAREWADIVSRDWKGWKSSNRGTRAREIPAGHLLEYHPCEPSDRRWPNGRQTIVNTDCGQIINYLNGGKRGGAHVERIQAYVRDVLRTGAHFHYYGFEDLRINVEALDAIAAGCR